MQRWERPRGAKAVAAEGPCWLEGHDTSPLTPATHGSRVLLQQALPQRHGGQLGAQLFSALAALGQGM